MPFRVGIDASNLRAGGGVTHLVQILAAVEPELSGVSQITVWGSNETLERVVDRAWLHKVQEPLLEGSILQRTYWQQLILPSAAARVCDLLFVPGGNYLGGFRPFVTMCRNMLPFERAERRRYGKLSYQFLRHEVLRNTQKRTFERADGLIFLTQYAREHVTAVMDESPPFVTTIPHGVSTNFFRSPRHQEQIAAYSAEMPFRWLYVSSVNVYKHHPTLIAAVAQLRERGYPIKLDLIGPAYRQALRDVKRAIEHFRLDDGTVLYHGELRHQDLEEAYHRADAFVYSSSCENMPNILLEAMAAGLPIACARRGPMPDILQAGGVYYDPENSESTAAAMAQLMDDHELRTEVSALAFARATEYSWARCARQTFDFLGKVHEYHARAKSTRQIGRRVSKHGGLRILGQEWEDSYLDYHKGRDEARITVKLWANVRRIEGLYFVRPRSWRLVWNYFKTVGPFNVVRKIRSRLQERLRNQKHLAVGIGEIVEPADNGTFRRGERVLFIATAHPRAVERVCVSEMLVRHWADTGPEDHKGLEVYDALPDEVGRELSDLAGWSPYSGVALNSEELDVAFEAAAAVLDRLRGVGRQPIATLTGPPSPVREYAPAQEPATPAGALSAVLFGLGNYAKVAILPTLPRQIMLKRIHEIDPTQMDLRHYRNVVCDTSAFVRPDMRYDVYFIAGFHHTHAPLAIHALNDGSFAVVEKPLATTHAQLVTLKAAMLAHPGRLFSCFHMRFSPFNDLARRHLKTSAETPISYHCIVFEEPLPARHWYRWPASGSRLLSNGCHWIDHFMFMNDYAPVHKRAVYDTKAGDVTVVIELENGASFTMVLSDTGSDRLGVRDYIELKAGRRIVRWRDGRRYEAETHERIVERQRIGRLSAHKVMYSTIGQAILTGKPGDSLESLRSTELVLALEDEYQSSVIVTPRAPSLQIVSTVGV